MRLFRRFWALCIVSLLLVSSLTQALPIRAAVPGAADAQSIAHNKAEMMLAEMSTPEKVGQLFLLGFRGNDTGRDALITSLVQDYHIGGVVLSSANDNFQPGQNPAAEAAALIEDLQSVEWDTSNQNETLDQPSGDQYIPLYIGISQPGDSAPQDQIFDELTILPSLMAIGATWDTNTAYQTGAVLGQELSALGFNFLLGPALDVVEGDSLRLGINSFGASPAWVGSLGQHYIEGIHTGAGNRMTVIARTFPGSGGADRATTTEVATVLKTWETLDSVDLQPFYAVTGGAPEAVMQADGLLLSHIRYQALQGTIRPTTRPVTLDGEAMQTLFSQPMLGSWEASGGLVVSDNLASLSIRKFFDPLNFTFDARQVTSSALIAGNDLLILDGLVSGSDESSYLLLVDTLTFFAQKYEDDPVFAEHVDQSVLKILASKYTLYDNFELETVLPGENARATIGEARAMVFNVAQNAVTLLSPDLADLNNVLPDVPASRERILFISDTLSARQCTRCEAQTVFSERGLMDAVLRLYGPQGSGQVLANRLSSYSFAALRAYLDDTQMEFEHPVLEELQLADWVVFSMLDVDNARAASQALKLLLAQKPDLLRDKKVVVFAFNNPAQLDATEISNISAYYALYAKADEFVDVAARVLFKDLPLNGALPISLPAIGYDVSQAIQPDPNQVIPLELDLETLATMLAAQEGALEPTPIAAEEEPLETPTPTMEPAPAFQVNDQIPLVAGPIYDHNGNLVPDGTVVQFQAVLYTDSPGLTQVINTRTTRGMARAVFPIQRSGLMEIRVISEPAQLSSVLQIDVPSEGNALIMEVTPLPPAERTPPTAFPTFTLEPTVTVTPSPTVTPQPGPVNPQPQAEEWIMGMALSWVYGFAAFVAVYRNHNLRWQARRGLLVTITSIVGYSYLALNLPGAKWLFNATNGMWSTLIVCSIGALVGFLLGWVWRHEFE
ncbi:MAG: hypothetical protein HPY85_15860 [Anaerolineae bacterium]|nr:hypothetical protein [Anaerolineae bacterium]